MQWRRAEERGKADHGWLQSWHSFSFAGYYDPAFMGYGPLRVINEDRIAPGAGFATHGHRDMEIFTWMLSGQLNHEDSMGHRASLQCGEVQYMSAGSGVEHSEYNGSSTAPAHLLQIWIEPWVRGEAPRYQQIRVDAAALVQGWVLLLSPDGALGSIPVKQDARVYAIRLDAAQRSMLPAGCRRYLHVARGQVHANGQLMQAGDALMLDPGDVVMLDQAQQAEVLRFDLP